MIAKLSEALKGDWKKLATKLGYKDNEVGLLIFQKRKSSSHGLKFFFFFVHCREFNNSMIINFTDQVFSRKANTI